MKPLYLGQVKTPTWEVGLNDPDETVVELNLPTVDMYDKLLAYQEDFRSAKGDTKTLSKMYELVAELLSNNTAGESFSAREIRTKYGMSFQHIIVFFDGYVDFIAEVSSQKN